MRCRLACGVSRRCTAWIPWPVTGSTTAVFCCFFFQAEDGIRDLTVTGVQTCALPIFNAKGGRMNFPEPNFTDIRSASQTLEALAECNAGPVTITGGTEPTRTLAASVSRSEEGRVGEEGRSRGGPDH